MIHMRPSRPDDVPRLRELWRLAFGDTDEYMDNFFRRYYRPERMLVLEEDGTIASMLAWFDTTLSTPDGSSWKAGYLYAVATHPDARGRGLCAALLQYTAAYLRDEQHCRVMTTVPAEPSLHNFFGGNGFKECFTHSQRTYTGSAPEDKPPFRLERISPVTYTGMREAILTGTPHIVFPEDAIAFQEGACALSAAGGLYAADTVAGTSVLCAEEGPDGILVKELLGNPDAVELTLKWLPALLPNWSGEYRVPGTDINFGMLQWLHPKLESCWDWSSTAYMGLGFD